MSKWSSKNLYLQSPKFSDSLNLLFGIFKIREMFLKVDIKQANGKQPVHKIYKSTIVF